ncbi:MAG TPA: cyclic-di-AMP receptor [Candidatus Limnocylindrales bacterium]|nr:cyclic-di-AMP receptor [Candidatus Limnocylindrales bacterium]
MAKLLIAVVHAQDAAQLVEALRGAELRMTEVLSRGGFLQARNTMLYIGVEDDQVSTAMRLIEENCSSRTEDVPAEPLGGLDANWLPTEVTHGGATVFVVPLDEIRRI